LLLLRLLLLVALLPAEVLHAANPFSISVLLSPGRSLTEVAATAERTAAAVIGVQLDGPLLLLIPVVVIATSRPLPPLLLLPLLLLLLLLLPPPLSRGAEAGLVRPAGAAGWAAGALMSSRLIVPLWWLWE
jgi:hypothetical protein